MNDEVRCKMIRGITNNITDIIEGTVAMALIDANGAPEGQMAVSRATAYENTEVATQRLRGCLNEMFTA